MGARSSHHLAESLRIVYLTLPITSEIARDSQSASPDQLLDLYFICCRMKGHEGRLGYC